MAFPIFTLLTTTSKQAFAENTNLNTAKSLKIQSTMNFKIQKKLPAFCLPVRQPAVRPGSASATALEFLHNKGNRIRFTKLLFRRTFIH